MKTLLRNLRISSATASLLLGIATSTAAVPTNSVQLDDALKPLAPLLGKTWKADFKDSTPERPQADVMTWERILNGKAVRVLHSINNGEYGGETIITWDNAAKSIVYYYFTTAGYKTTGTMKIEDGKFVSHEIVSGGSANDVSEVKSVSEIRADGSFHNKSMYLKKGEWVPGHEFHYHEAPDAKVIFK